MSIAPLPTPVPAATGRGAARTTGAPGCAVEGSDPTADVFATLVEAVLAAASGGATGDVTSSGPDAAVPGTPEATPGAVTTEPDAAEAQLLGGDATGDATQAGSTDPEDATAAEDALDAAATPDPAVAGTAPVALTLPLTSPALAAALGLTRPTPDQGPDQGPAQAPGSSQAPTDAVAEAPSTGTSGGDLPVAAGPAPEALLPGTPLPLDDQAVPDPTAPTAAGRHADGTSPDAARMTSHETRTGDGRQDDAAGPTLVPTVSGAEAPARAAEAQPTTAVTRSAAAQVVPELTRLVQAGPGTHRMVLRLDPGTLGEVRITLTVHPGGVRVRMATGSEDARAALSDGLPALQRALETVAGRPAGETQLAVLHQPGGGAQSQQGQQGQHSTAYDGGSSSTQPDASASDHQTPDDRPQAGDRDAGRPAGTQVGTTARDGSQGEGTPRPADPLTSHRRARLDVSM